MFKSRRPPRKIHRFAWLLGFMGFLGFRYFWSHELPDLFFFSFLSFFSFFFTVRLTAEMPDERYEENRQKAKAATVFVPALSLFIIGIGVMRGYAGEGFVVLVSALGWAATFITYAVAFWYYEKH